MNQFLPYALLTGFSWGVWALLLKASHLQGGWPLIISYSGALIIGIIIQRDSSLPPLKGAAISLMAGAIAGVGTFFFTKITSSNLEKASLSRLFSICVLVELLTCFVGGCFFFGEELTARKIFGCVFAGIAMWLFV